MAPTLITLLTDFGTADGYVAEMKGVLYSLLPSVAIVDVSHDIPPQDVDSARVALSRYWRRFPPGTVHLVVVDPGVGTARAAIAAESDSRYLVGPDNGVLSPALLAPGARVLSIAVPPHASQTFHGRDVFAPAAARLAAGTPFDQLGRPFEGPVVRRTASVRQREDGAVEGEVIAVDHFGNALTNLVARAGWHVEAGTLRLPLVRTYADVPSGSLCGVAGSSGFIEIALRDGDGARAAGLARGARVFLLPPDAF